MHTNSRLHWGTLKSFPGNDKLSPLWQNPDSNQDWQAGMDVIHTASPWHHAVPLIARPLWSLSHWPIYDLTDSICNLHKVTQYWGRGSVLIYVALSAWMWKVPDDECLRYDDYSCVSVNFTQIMAKVHLNGKFCIIIHHPWKLGHTPLSRQMLGHTQSSDCDHWEVWTIRGCVGADRAVDLLL